MVLYKYSGRWAKNLNSNRCQPEKRWKRLSDRLQTSGEERRENKPCITVSHVTFGTALVLVEFFEMVLVQNWMVQHCLARKQRSSTPTRGPCWAKGKECTWFVYVFIYIY